MELAKQVFSSSERKSSEGYSMYSIKAPTLSEDEDEEAGHDNTLAWDDSSIHVASGGTPVTGSFVPAIGGPFSALTPSMWPQDILSRIQQTEDAGDRPTGHYDEFGFMVDGDLEFEHKDPDPGNFVTSEDEGLRLKWTAYLEFTQNQDVGDMTWDKVSPSFPHSDKLRELVYLGIPHSMRAPIWMRISGALQKKISSDFTYKQIVRASADENSLTARQIEKGSDANHAQQCMNGNDCGLSVTLCRRGRFLLVMCTVVEDLVPTSYYSSTLIGVQADQRVLRQLIVSYLPPMDDQLKEHDIELSLITLHWFLTAFASVVHTKEDVNFKLKLDNYSTESSTLCQGLYPVMSLMQIKTVRGRTVAECLQGTRALFLEKCMEKYAGDPAAKPKRNHCLTALDVITRRRNRQVKTHGLPLWPDLGVSGGTRYVIKQSYLELYRLNTKQTCSLLQRLQKRTIAPPRTFFSLLFGKGGISLQKAKNIRQTELVADLREAILQIARHFDAVDPKKGLEVDYSMESHARDHERFINVARNRRRRAKALLDFERHDDDELGFRKNDIVTIISQRMNTAGLVKLNGLRGWFPAKFVEIWMKEVKSIPPQGTILYLKLWTDLVRGGLCPALKSIFLHGMRKPSILGGPCHPWLFMEEVSEVLTLLSFCSIAIRGTSDILINSL
ncbi:Small G protein signaling modulator 3 [Desmophyllum pertusum]|uniref:RUN and TBC1 domain-containing protein 3 n=1 Tax=Desmophyllum pertusum TaxID=174260 RepID=A0A9W9ZAS2_9CNID|nr:Small G protein signaling modulator 3 [Desmophyllum pertusum]